MEHVTSKGKYSPDTVSTGNGREVGYKVEARMVTPYGPTQIGEQIFDGEWREVRFKPNANGFGVPSGNLYSEMWKHDLVPLTTARSLAWWLLASRQSDQDVECRLVEFALQTTYIVVRNGVVDEAFAPEWRSPTLIKDVDLSQYAAASTLKGPILGHGAGSNQNPGCRVQ